MNRARCIQCGQMYGHRAVVTEQIRWPRGKTMPSYTGDGIVVKTHGPWNTDNNEQVATRYIWDGQSYKGGYDPFCMLRCALEYARKAYAESRSKPGRQQRRSDNGKVHVPGL